MTQQSQQSLEQDLGGGTRQESFKAAMSKAGRFLARRPHSRAELAEKLKTFDSNTVEAVLARLDELGLIDDDAFAEQWVRERSSGRGSRALSAELAQKGVAPESIGAALAGAGDEAARADELAGRYLRKVAHKPPAKQAGSIQGMLLRRGFSLEVAIGAARRALPPVDWD